MAVYWRDGYPRAEVIAKRPHVEEIGAEDALIVCPLVQWMQVPRADAEQWLIESFGVQIQSRGERWQEFGADGLRKKHYVPRHDRPGTVYYVRKGETEPFAVTYYRGYYVIGFAWIRNGKVGKVHISDH